MDEYEIINLSAVEPNNLIRTEERFSDDGGPIEIDNQEFQLIGWATMRSGALDPVFLIDNVDWSHGTRPITMSEYVDLSNGDGVKCTVQYRIIPNKEFK